MNQKPKYNEIVFTKEQEKQIVDMYIMKNFSTVKIGKRFNVSHKIIAKVLDKHNISRTGVGKRRYFLDEHYFDEINTPNKAYILGLLFADGYNSIDKDTIRIQLQYLDKDILEQIRIELKSDKPLKFIKCSDKVASNGFVSKDMYQLEFHSAHLCRTLMDIGMVQNKSLVLNFPTIDKSLYSHFIRGYFDGDGSLYTYTKTNGGMQNTLTITSTDKFCNKCLNILKDELNIGGGVYDASSHNGITKVLSVCGNIQVKKVLDWFYKDADLFMQRKYDLYKNKFAF